MDKFPLASSGLRYLTGGIFLALVAQALDVYWLAWPLWLFTAFTAFFFRDPARSHQASENEFISPADGKVVAIEEVEHPALPGGRALLISIFMSIFDVHVNRLPISGEVVSVRHMPGGFQPANRPGARVKNERVEVTLETPAGVRMVVAQVAGLVARRVVNSLIPGEPVIKGVRFGMIRFGSRLDLYLPTESEISVSLGDRVRAGVSVMGRLQP